MAELTIFLDDQIKARWAQLAELRGVDPHCQIRAAIVAKLEELEERRWATGEPPDSESMRTPPRTTSSDR